MTIRDLYLRAADAALNLLFDITEPLAGTCPVCAFWRGVAAALVLQVLGKALAYCLQ